MTTEDLESRIQSFESLMSSPTFGKKLGDKIGELLKEGKNEEEILNKLTKEMQVPDMEKYDKSLKKSEIPEFDEETGYLEKNKVGDMMHEEIREEQFRQMALERALDETGKRLSGEEQLVKIKEIKLELEENKKVMGIVQDNADHHAKKITKQGRRGYQSSKRDLKHRH